MQDGLSDDHVQCFVQDEMGYLWIGTRDGLNRYDGRTFIPFKSSVSSSSIAGNNISAMDISADGMIWVGTSDGGLCSLDPRTFEVQRYPISNDFADLSESILSIKCAEQSVYIGYEKSPLIRFESATHQFKVVLDSMNYIAPSTYSIAFDEQNRKLFFGHIHGGLKWIQDSSKVEFQNSPGLDRYPAYTLNDIEVENNLVWAGAWDNALHCFDLESSEHQYFTLNTKEIDYSGNEISSIERTGKLLWLGTRRDGLYLFDTEQNEMQRVDSRIWDPARLKGSRIETIYKDDRGRLWIGTEEGVNIYDPALNHFEIHFVDDNPDISFNCFAQLNDSILSGTSEGLLLIDNMKNLAVNSASPSIFSLLNVRNGPFLLGTDKSIYKWDAKNAELKLFPVFKSEHLEMYWDIPSSRVIDIVQYEKNGDNHLLGFYYGYDLLVMDPESRNSTPNHIGREGNYENLVRNLFIDTAGRLWALGASKGLIQVTDEFHSDSIRKADRPHSKGGYRYNLLAESFSKKGSHPNTLACADITDMIEYSRDKYYVLTNGCGLYSFQYDQVDSTFISLNSPVNNLMSAVLDESGVLWMLSSKGILKYEPSTDKYTLFGRNHGLPIKSLGGRLFHSTDDRIYIGGHGLYVEFDPKSISLNEDVSSNRLEKVIVNDTMQLSSADWSNLNYDQNFLKIVFSSPNLTDPASNSYRYRLIGLEEDWHETTELVQAQYTSLPPGEYQFEVTSSNNDGYFNSPETLFAFRISPPWWKTWWFLTFLILVASAAVYALYRYRVSQIERLFEVRAVIAKDLHDDIGSTLGSISIYSEVAKNALGQQDKAGNVIDIIGETSRGMMDKVSDIVWSVNPENDGIMQTIDRMKNFSTPLLQNKGIEVRFNVDLELEEVKLDMQQRRNVFLIFKESVHNIVKYADATVVEIDLKRVENRLWLKIKDNGRGFDQEMISPYNGNGLINIKQRAAEINGRVIIRSKPKNGTSIELEF